MTSILRISKITCLVGFIDLDDGCARFQRRFRSTITEHCVRNTIIEVLPYRNCNYRRSVTLELPLPRRCSIGTIIIGTPFCRDYSHRGPTVLRSQLSRRYRTSVETERSMNGNEVSFPVAVSPTHENKSAAFHTVAFVRSLVHAHARVLTLPIHNKKTEAHGPAG